MEVKEVFRVEDVLGLPATRPAAEGLAQLDVTVSGPWQGFTAPTAVGTAQLRNVRAEMHGLNTPIEIASATISLDPDAVRIEKISARTESTHWSGRIMAPRHCSGPSPGATFAPGVVPPIIPTIVSTFPLQFVIPADQLSTGTHTLSF